MTGIEAIAKEREEQITKHRRTVEADFALNSHDINPPLTKAASSLSMLHTEMAMHFGKPDGWDQKIWEHMCSKPYKERLAIAGALIAAEYDRVDYEENIPGA